ncbi:hypothetical protein G9F72_013130 [Clostridium estertheticum]|uniref:hypothetical protein n=1 Tax=Clostridium estertheticum TaxID=238834 RepID=UPI0013E95373|nr:hypothetical protein [Clostridium estertheticum]MBZ9687270.1 hypothetical protein [Clostridium estertheticum]
MDKNEQSEKDTSESIKNLYSNNNLENHKTKSSESTQLKAHGESQKYIKEMHELADKNEFKNNITVIGLFIVIAAIIVFSILMNTSFMNPKTDVVTNKVATKSTVDSTIKPITSQEKIYEYLGVEANRTSTLKKAIELNKGSKTGVTVYLLSEILRSNEVAIPKETSTVKQLMTDLTSMEWKKNTDLTKLEKGDICFTTDVAKKPGVPSHAYVFMGWVEDGKTDYANICDGQVQEYTNILHKRNVSISVSEKDKFSFFLRK